MAKKDVSPRLGVSVSKEFYKALQLESARSGRTISTIVRMALEEYMRDLGYREDPSVSWGGPKGEKEEGQLAAVSVR